MQFHLNGFRPGDPEIHDRIDHGEQAEPPAPLPSEVDVLIIGCGPAGLTLAAQLSAFSDIKTRIVDQKAGPLLVGQADGIACRTMEMFEAFGFAGRVAKEAYWVNETTFWKPNENDRTNIVRSGRIQDVEDGLSEFPHVILNQARVHDFFLDVMKNAPSSITPHYARRLTKLDIIPDAADPMAHPVTARFERVGAEEPGQIETVKARYVIGCDGARSKVRASLGRTLYGDSANQAWGVMDVLAITDFPDIRLKAAIQSANEGNILIIPREGGYLVRIYVELDKLRGNERVASRNLTVDDVIRAAKQILQPYTLDVKEVAWWSVYEIGQRLCEKFDDVPETDIERRSPRVFIAGDACHTHSPKAGQGMNVSMQDSFNLGWKLATVLRGQCAPALLHSYSSERQTVAQALIDFDREWAKMFSDPPKDAANTGKGIDPALFQANFIKQGRYTAGVATHYAPSILTGPPTYQHLAKGFVNGMRFHSAPVIRLADAKPMQLGHVIKADGRFRLFVFADKSDDNAVTSKLTFLCNFLSDSPDSPICKYTTSDADIDSVIDMRAIFQKSHRDLAIETMPPFLLPQKGRYRLHDYEKIFCSDLRGGQDIFDMRGIDRDRGCMVIVRPDQYIAHVLPLDAYTELTAFFDGFMRQQAEGLKPLSKP